MVYIERDTAIGSLEGYKACESSRVHESMTTPPSQLMLLGYSIWWRSDRSSKSGGSGGLCAYEY